LQLGTLASLTVILAQSSTILLCN